MYFKYMFQKVSNDRNSTYVLELDRSVLVVTPRTSPEVELVMKHVFNGETVGIRRMNNAYS